MAMAQHQNIYQYAQSGIVPVAGSQVVPPGRPGAGTYVHVPALVPFGTTQGRSGDCEQEICRNALYGIVSFAPVRPLRKYE
eukprot:2542950-Ditylum_brightwellii.AAC.1